MARRLSAEQRLWWGAALAVLVSSLEGWAGTRVGSLSLVADAGHMAGDALSLGLAAAADRLARHWRGAHPQHVHAVAAAVNSILLAAAGASMVHEAWARWRQPHPVEFGPAVLVAGAALAVSLITLWILESDDSGHDHRGHAHPDGVEHHAAAENRRAALLHVAADALTSVLTLLALAAGWMGAPPGVDTVAGGLAGLWILRWGLLSFRRAAALVWT